MSRRKTTCVVPQVLESVQSLITSQVQVSAPISTTPPVISAIHPITSSALPVTTSILPTTTSTSCHTALLDDEITVLSTDIVEEIINLTDFDPARSGDARATKNSYTVPRPILPEIQLPAPAASDVIEDITSQLLSDDNIEPLNSSSEPTLQSAFMTLIDAVKENTAALKDVKQQLVRNGDKLDKIEIAVRRGYEHDKTHAVRPWFNRSNNRFRNTRLYSPSSPAKRKFIP